MNRAMLRTQAAIRRLECVPQDLATPAIEVRRAMHHAASMNETDVLDADRVVTNDILDVLDRVGLGDDEVRP